MLYKACFLQLTPATSAWLGSVCLAGLRSSPGCSEWFPPSPARTGLQSTATDVAYAITFEHRRVQAHCPSLSVALTVILKSQHYLKNPSGGAHLLPFAILFQVSYRIICAAGFSSGWSPTCYLNQTKYNMLFFPAHTHHSLNQHKEACTQILKSYSGEETSALHSLLS